MDIRQDLINADRRAKRICETERNLDYVGAFQYKATIRRRGFSTASKTFDDVDAACDWRNRKLHEMNSGQYVDERAAKTTTLASILKRYAKEVAPLITSREKYARQLSSKLHKIADRPIGDVLLAELAPAHLQAFRDERKQEVRRKTLKEDLSEISRVIEYARFEWHLSMPQGNPVNVKLLLKHIPNDRVERKPIRSDSLIEKLLIACGKYGDGHSLKDLVELGLETGMRRTQLVELLWENIFLDEKIAYVINKDRRSDGQALVGIPLLPKAVDVLRRIGEKNSGKVFIYNDPSSVTKAMSRVRLRNKDIPDFELITPHVLRHTMIHKMKKQGVPSEIAKVVTGHKTDQMHNHYGKLTAEDVVEMIGQKEG